MMIKSYCTAEFVKSSKLTGICRLFAVIVHTGKISHSGHYIAYEWWKVDDAKVTKVPLSEVLNAEAYMLFYRVVKHPMSEELTKEKEELDAKRKADLEAAGLLPVAAAADDNKEGQSTAKVDPTSTSSDAKSALGKRKIKEPELWTGIEWARTKTSLKAEDNPSLKVADELVSENIQLKADYFKLLSDAAKDDSPSTTIGVSGKLRTAYYVVMSEPKPIFQWLSSSHICLCFLHLTRSVRHRAATMDIQGGPERYRLPLLKYLHKLVTTNGSDKEVLSSEKANGPASHSLAFLDNDSVL